MQHIGFEKKQAKGLEGEDKKKSAKRWCRIDVSFDEPDDEKDERVPGEEG